MTTLRALLVEDSEMDAQLVVRELSRAGRDVVSLRVDTAEAMRRALVESSWDVVLSDWSMPKFSAPAALALLGETGLDIPFLIVSGTVGEETAVAAMRAGAHDFILKDKLARLAPAIEREVRERAMRQAHGRTTHALRLSEARFARLAESGIIGIAFADIDGNIHDANDAYFRILGWTREELSAAGAHRWSDITPPEWAAADAAATERLRTTGTALPWEKEMLRKDGSHVPVLVGVAMLEPPNCIAFIADLTERRRAEEALDKTAAQLRQAQKMEAIGSLAGGIAHDFNNLLSVILSYSDVNSIDLAPGDPLRDDIAEIHKAGRRAAELTRQLLAFSRRQVLQPRLIDLDDALAGMKQLIRRLIGEDVELSFETKDEPHLVRVDPGQVEQVVMNLAVNARDAMAQGGMLTIETANVVLDEEFAAQHVGVTPGPHVMLAVSDTGCGMDRDTQARIFEPFFTTKEAGRGTGLGLSTVLGIVQQSGGTVWVYSEPGIGTTFKIYFVAAQVDTAELEDDEDPAEPSDLRGSETILLVEDDTSLRALIRTILGRNGYRVLEAHSGGDALLICEQHERPIDLLLTDVVMPRMSGRQLAERLAPLRPDMRVLYMSGYTDDAVVRHGVLEHDVAFIQKPIMPAALVAKVRETLDAKPRRRPK